ncbi:hypothetical protein psyc5s11_19000 [Clostridium gelidum]|uniref:PD-(D/E)XK nuclease superfamily protein n=1 Tax=Clostridium gelidum TaxID=704125 RepID=A0ABM7T2I6_9CLOT|nr:PD-(D/E)XK nuclease family protein [Clostridium gelidum]BCZ45833.1 hypothetical protein psyc5s11_19000 [Clostridium gelidum]
MNKNNLLREATLIKEADKIIKANSLAKKQNDIGFNIFTTLNIERDEVFTHSNMIYALLNPKGIHGMGDTYLKLFLAEIGISKNFLTYSWAVEREWIFENGRIDFFLKCEKMCIAIEMKIDARDQDKQLFRYEEYSKGINSNYLIYYLTLNEKDPSDQSAKGIDRRYFKCITFKVHILNWLKACLAATNENMAPYNFIKQYLYLIQKLVGEEKMAEAMKNLIKNGDDLMAAITIANSINEVKTEVLLNFMDELNKLLISSEVNLIKYDREEVKSYYKGSSIPKQIYKIEENHSHDAEAINFILGIEITDTLYYYFCFIKKDKDGSITFINKEEIEKNHSEIFKKCSSALEKVFGEIRRSSSVSLLWENIMDANGYKYDFKHFSANCVELKDNYVKEAKRIAEIIINLKKAVEKQLPK